MPERSGYHGLSIAATNRLGSKLPAGAELAGADWVAIPEADGAADDSAVVGVTVGVVVPVLGLAVPALHATSKRHGRRAHAPDLDICAPSRAGSRCRDLTHFYSCCLNLT
jgi:hypothetical protein